MNFHWSDYHVLATNLQSETDGSLLDEAKLRCALSRAYYAAFCSARNLLLTQDTRLEDTISHSDVRNEFHSRSYRGKTVARKLRDMAEKRECADYRDNFPDLISDTKFVIEEAQKVIDMVSNWKRPNKPSTSA